ncbi:hypothetical protein, partial [Klebsiella pneumoniae]|uniref:hypothetical protein n=1 Tax=Klebsiella pneumoniae TaxID=573 RepID=UPI0025A15ACF
TDFYNVVDSSFVKGTVLYFGTSALGNPPVKDGNQVFLQHIDPIRILDPFLWMMAREGLIKEI